MLDHVVIGPGVMIGSPFAGACVFEAEREVRTSKTSTIVLALVTALSGSLAARAQTVTHPYHVHHSHPPHHAVHHHAVVRNAAQAPTPAARRPAEAVENTPSPQTNQLFKPYAHPGDGDNDGLSRDPDDCMKGCIGGNPQ
jgi:hypothetical protein